MSMTQPTSLRIRVKEGDELKDYLIVHPDIADPLHGLLSWDSPLAQALQHRYAGETITTTLPSGREVSMTILHIERSYQVH